MLFFVCLLLLFHSQIQQHRAETVTGCTVHANNNDRVSSLPNNKASVTLACANHGYILVRNLTFGVHKSPSITPACSFQPDDCTTRTSSIGMECNGLTSCHLDLNPQYLHICTYEPMFISFALAQGGRT